MGADLRQCNVFGFTPLHTAMLAGREDIALYLAAKEQGCAFFWFLEKKNYLLNN